MSPSAIRDKSETNLCNDVQAASPLISMHLCSWEIWNFVNTVACSFNHERRPLLHRLPRAQHFWWTPWSMRFLLASPTGSRASLPLREPGMLLLCLCLHSPRCFKRTCRGRLPAYSRRKAKNQLQKVPPHGNTTATTGSSRLKTWFAHYLHPAAASTPHAVPLGLLLPSVDLSDGDTRIRDISQLL